jgi:hypothetical protein
MERPFCRSDGLESGRCECGRFCGVTAGWEVGGGAGAQAVALAPQGKLSGLMDRVETADEDMSRIDFYGKSPGRIRQIHEPRGS